MKNNIVYVDFNERKVLSAQSTPLFIKIKNFIKKLFFLNKFENKKNSYDCKRILNKRHFS
ncbi:hypothetical protein CP6013_02995 [Clostridium pasteurianum DSM 525 = ATCC 6013]|uniref:Uncharacterized protein n=1 Tax=Clostridium pasteurianum DSM 525 = ATCC 6013 TaxID=1262449 RepID=A0A837SC25_CLOPA|nr:hypothetical protein AQ983_00745 [Clostridium pasteurianum DSM 525 = ATCC 6013]AOZ77503.1 hypothetical protein AQ984_00745 [Clostridium pasteurianum]KRU13747.1 hypothetical protein CP6013_02995 [Clostridium pasteurianum DSM 525 = ATCC 6013]